MLLSPPLLTAIAPFHRSHDTATVAFILRPIYGCRRRTGPPLALAFRWRNRTEPFTSTIICVVGSAESGIKREGGSDIDVTLFNSSPSFLATLMR